MKTPLSLLLSAFLGLFLADALVSLLDDSLILFLGIHVLGGVRVLVGLVFAIAAMGVYLLVGLTPMAPKRLMLPLTLFVPVTALATLPVLTLYFAQMEWITWAVSLAQVGCGLLVLRMAQGKMGLRWPLVPVERLGDRGFSWWNLTGFVAANVFLLAPCAVLYLAWCASFAVDHFSAGFLALRPSGVSVQARTYTRSDGRTIRLVPMMHIGDASFYREVERLFPTNSVVLLEGVTDDRKRMEHKLSYQNAASALGLVEQKDLKAPKGARRRRADVDLSDFSKDTIAVLDHIAAIHKSGPTAANVLKFMKACEAPGLEQRLLEDILHMRNRHLVGEIQKELKHPAVIVVPWGAAHMPAVEADIKSLGFVTVERRDLTVVSFRGNGEATDAPGGRKVLETPGTGGGSSHP